MHSDRTFLDPASSGLYLISYKHSELSGCTRDREVGPSVDLAPGVGAGLERGRHWRKGRAQHAERGGAATAGGWQGVLRRQAQAREKRKGRGSGTWGPRRAEGSGGQSVWAWALGSPAGWGGEGRDDRLCLRPGGRLGSTQGWQSRSCSGSWNSLAQLPGSVCFHLALGSQTT